MNERLKQNSTENDKVNSSEGVMEAADENTSVTAKPKEPPAEGTFLSYFEFRHVISFLKILHNKSNVFLF